MTRAPVARALAAAACLLVATPAAAQPDARSGATLVAIVTSEPDAPLTRRVRAELESLGVDVLVLKPPAEATETRAPLERAARGVGAAAAVRLVASSEGKVEVWVADRVTGKAVVRELDASGTNASDAAVAVGTVELLRASLLELHAAEPPRGEVAPTPALERLATSVPAPPRLGLAAGSGVELGVTGLGPSLDARASLWVRLSPRVGLRVVGATTVVPAGRDEEAGEVELGSSWIGASGVYAFADTTSTWVPEVALGIAAAHVSTIGTARAPYVGSTADAWAAAPFASAGIGWAFVRGIRLRADATVYFAVPAIEVVVPRADRTAWGAPGITLAPAIEVLWSP
jgi:hypothetical protein